MNTILSGPKVQKKHKNQPPTALPIHFSSKITDHDRAQKSRGYARTACAVGIAPEGYSRPRAGIGW